MRDRYLAISLAVIVFAFAKPGFTAEAAGPDISGVATVDAEPLQQVAEPSPEADEPELEILDPPPMIDGEPYPRLRRFMPRRLAAWYFQADALALRRDTSSDRAMAALGQSDWNNVKNPCYNSKVDPAYKDYMWEGTTSTTTDLTTSLNSFRAGGRLLLGRSLGRNSVVEVSYFDLAGWRNAKSISNNVPLVVYAAKYGYTIGENTGEFLPTLTLPGSLFSPLSDFGNWIDLDTETTPSNPSETIPFDGNNVAEIRYASSLDNLEWNFRHWIVRDPRFLQVSLLIGGRYMNVNESFYYHTERYAITPATGSTVGSAMTSITTDTENPMIGVQVGGTYESYIARGWWLDCRLKVAILNNDARQTTFFTHQGDDSYDGWHQSEVSNSKIASAVDASIGTKIYINRHMAVDISYQLLYVNGLALASDNFNADPDILRNGTAPINLNGDVLYHGARLGVSCTW